MVLLPTAVPCRNRILAALALTGSMALAGCDLLDSGGSVSDCASPTTIEVSPSMILLKGVGDTARVTAVADGGTDCGPVWTSLVPSIATVSAEGLVTAARAGQAIIRLEVGERAGHALTTVAVRHPRATEWRLRSPPSAADLNAAWGTSSGNVYAVGAGGTILHYDGAAWTAMESGTDRDLLDVWGWSDAEVWAVGEGGTILRHRADGWERMESGTTGTLNAVWGPSPTVVYAVGDGIVGYDGSAWRFVDTGGPFSDIWGTSADEMFLTGVVYESWEDPGYRHAALSRFDGAAIEALTIPFPADEYGTELESGLLAIHGTSEDDLIAVGYGYPLHDPGIRRPYLLRYDGTEWRLMEAIDSLGSLEDVWAATSEEIIIAGERRSPEAGETAVLFHSVGGEWLSAADGFEAGLRGVWRSGDGHAFAVGEKGTILSNDGTGWRFMHAPLPPTRAIWGTGRNHVVAVGPGGSAVYDGTNWLPRFGRTAIESLTAVWGASRTNVLAVGARGVVLGFDGAAWKGLVESEGLGYLTEDTLFGIWGSAPDRTVLVGAGGAIFRSNGGGWGAVPSGTDATLRAVWGFARDRVVVVGDGGTILRSDGEGWATQESATDQDLMAVWGSDPDTLYAVGRGGQILFGGAAGWEPMSSPTTADLKALRGTSSDNVYAAGVDGVILHYDGEVWEIVASGTSADFSALWGGEGEWWVGGWSPPSVLVQGTSP